MISKELELKCSKIAIKYTFSFEPLFLTIHYLFRLMFFTEQAKVLQVDDKIIKDLGDIYYLTYSKNKGNYEF